MDPGWFKALREHRIPDWVFAVTALSVALFLYLAWTCGRWLPRLLGALDRFLVRVGFGTYAARLLTWLEGRFGGNWDEKGGNGER